MMRLSGDMGMKFNAARFFKRHIERSVGCTEPAAIALTTSVALNAIFGKLPKWLSEVSVSEVSEGEQCSSNGDSEGSGKSGDSKNSGGMRDSKNESAENERKQHVSGRKQHGNSVHEVLSAVEEVSVQMDRGVFKNAMNAVIPNTKGMSGVELAAALGLFCDPELGLMLFSDLNEEKVRAALSIRDKVHVNPDYEREQIFIRTIVRANGVTGECITMSLHTNIVSVKVNGRKVFEESPHRITMDEDMRILAEMRIEDLIHIVERLPEDAKNHLRDALETNKKAYLHAASSDCSRRPDVSGFVGSGWVGNAAKMVHTAVECRMSGETMEVMTCAGSGNMGLTASLPLIALHEWFTASEKGKTEAKEEDILLRAFALTHLIANLVGIHSGFISAICGCTMKAGIGISAGIAYYLFNLRSQSSLSPDVSDAPDAPDMPDMPDVPGVMKANETSVVEVVKNAINNMASDILGVICEGASRKCALKASTAVISAARSAMLALKGVGYEGVAGTSDADVTLNRIGEIARSMENTDKKITKLLSEKSGMSRIREA